MYIYIYTTCVCVSDYIRDLVCKGNNTVCMFVHNVPRNIHCDLYHLVSILRQWLRHKHELIPECSQSKSMGNEC